MSISISGSQGAASLGNFDPSKMASKVASKMMSDLDSGKDGSISKDEFVSGMTSKGMSSTDAGKMYDSIDTKKNGTITKTDIESAVKSGTLKPPSGGSRPTSSGGPGGARGGGGAGGASGSSASSKSYEAADTNKDGTVSEQEALIYSLKHPSENSDSSQLGQNVDESV
jgi:Ca2+-binding EF-hand superfamily protein